VPGGDCQSPSVSGLKHERHKDPCRIPAQVYCDRTGCSGQYNTNLSETVRNTLLPSKQSHCAVARKSKSEHPTSEGGTNSVKGNQVYTSSVQWG